MGGRRKDADLLFIEKDQVRTSRGETSGQGQSAPRDKRPARDQSGRATTIRTRTRNKVGQSPTPSTRPPPNLVPRRTSWFMTELWPNSSYMSTIRHLIAQVSPPMDTDMPSHASARAFPLPTISEDTLHYVLHPASSSSPSASASTTSTTNAPTQNASSVDELSADADADASADFAAQATLITSHVASLLPSPWLWNKDPWELKVAGGDTESRGVGAAGVRSGAGEGAGEGGERKLEGRMRVGDAVDDEWLVVWLLREVSRRWRDLVIS